MFFVFSMANPVLAQMYGGQGWGWHDSGWGWGHIIFGGAMMILFWGGIITLIVLLVRWLGGTSQSSADYRPHGKAPIEILKERFAKGEIDREEFEERKKLLSE
jgi:putative membrane protein